MTPAVTLIEVGPRDGLQSDPALLSVADRAEFIRRAAAAGLRRIEAVSFVNPKRVPQMAGAEELMAELRGDDALAGVALIGLALNRRGLDRAIDCGVDEVNSVVMCTDTFAQRNQGSDVAGLLDAAADITAGARDAGMTTTITVSASFGCPYEGEVSEDRFRSVLEGVAVAGADEVALADSIGVAVPAEVRRRLDIAREVLGDATALRCHFHNTRGTGVANCLAAADWGVRAIDASLGGIGGCPFAPRATGNVATEDVAYALDRSGYDLGIDLSSLVDVAGWLEPTLGHGVPALVSKAGLFP